MEVSSWPRVTDLASQNPLVSHQVHLAISYPAVSSYLSSLVLHIVLLTLTFPLPSVSAFTLMYVSCFRPSHFTYYV